jgi:hypothetical protein
MALAERKMSAKKDQELTVDQRNLQDGAVLVQALDRQTLHARVTVQDFLPN